MVVRRSSSVAAAARAAARERRTAQTAARRERERRVGELADAHAVASALVGEIRARAEREAAVHQAEADSAVVGLLELGERVEDVAELLGVPSPEVRAARRRARGGGPEAVMPAASPGQDAESGERRVTGSAGGAGDLDRESASDRPAGPAAA